MKNDKRLRLFAGPNGSGKTTLYGIVSEKCNLGVFVNADIIQESLNKTGKVCFDTFHVIVNRNYFIDKFEKSTLFGYANGLMLVNELNFIDNTLFIKENSESINSYFAAFIAEYVREELLLSGEKFTFETVMSDKRKLDFIRLAKENGYRVYLYYVTTMDAHINMERVQVRVTQGGHNVPKEKIVARYKKSLENLFEAIKLADRAYLFDNSFQKPTLIAELNDDIITNCTTYVPNWYQQYVIDKLSDK